MKLKTCSIHQYCLGNKLPRRLKDTGDGYSFGSINVLYRKEYFEVIDSFVEDLKNSLNKDFLKIFLQKLETINSILKFLIIIFRLVFYVCLLSFPQCSW